MPNVRVRRALRLSTRASARHLVLDVREVRCSSRILAVLDASRSLPDRLNIRLRDAFALRLPGRMLRAQAVDGYVARGIALGSMRMLLPLPDVGVHVLG